MKSTKILSIFLGVKLLLGYLFSETSYILDVILTFISCMITKFISRTINHVNEFEGTRNRSPFSFVGFHSMLLS